MLYADLNVINWLIKISELYPFAWSTVDYVMSRYIDKILFSIGS